MVTRNDVVRLPFILQDVVVASMLQHCCLTRDNYPQPNSRRTKNVDGKFLDLPLLDVAGLEAIRSRIRFRRWCLARANRRPTLLSSEAKKPLAMLSVFTVSSGHSSTSFTQRLFPRDRGIAISSHGYRQRIPPEFEKHVGNCESERLAVIKDRHNHFWSVRLVKTADACVFFTQGWAEFAAAHQLRIGDFVFFQYDGNFHFMARVFDGVSTFEKGVKPPQKGRVLRDQAASAKTSSTTNPSFSMVLGTSTTTGILQIPKYFLDKYFEKDISKIKLVNADGKKWRAYVSETGYLCGGWREFCERNNLKSRHNCVFELIAERQFKVYRCNTRSDH